MAPRNHSVSVRVNNPFRFSLGMVPAFNSTLKSMKQMVENLERNLCERVEEWTFYEDVLAKLENQLTETEKGPCSICLTI